jgi:signal transduction histidine kinase
VLQSGQQRATTNPDEIAREGVDAGAGSLTGTPMHVSGQPYGVLSVFGRCATVPANALQACEILGDQLGLYLHLRQALQRLQETRSTLQATSRSQAEALEDLEHQLGGPLLVATERVDLVIHHGRLDGRTESQLRAVRGLCRKAMRVAMSAGVFAALSKGAPPTPKLELLSADDILRLLISGADDAQLLSNPRRRIRFDVERDEIRALGRRLIKADRSFVEQCVGNLLDNAAKYSYEDTVVKVCGATADKSFAVTVTSTGLPVDPVDADRCLRRNWRGTAARVATGEGSGLGLWIADHLMRSMKGTVRVRPVRDSTTVLLTFPLA